MRVCVCACMCKDTSPHPRSGFLKVYNQLIFSIPRLFLLRDSQSNPKAFVLTLCHHQKIKNFQILPVSMENFSLSLVVSWVGSECNFQTPN